MRLQHWLIGFLLFTALCGCQTAGLGLLAPENTSLTQSAEVIPNVTVPPGTYVITNRNSRVSFVGQAGPIKQEGWFEQVDGEISFGPSNEVSVNMQIHVNTTSIWTQLGAQLTGHLKSLEFLDLEKFPTATFISKKSYRWQNARIT